MAEECIFYCFKEGDYHCNKSDEDILDVDFVKKYCWNYGYSDCPIYKVDSSSGGCYLTTACVVSRGLPDDCDELQTLRTFRDGYLHLSEWGRLAVEQYYHQAPKLVAIINSLTECQQIYDRIYTELVRPCVALIKGGKFEDAYQLYSSYVSLLYQQYIKY